MRIRPTVHFVPILLHLACFSTTAHRQLVHTGVGSAASARGLGCFLAPRLLQCLPLLSSNSRICHSSTRSGAGNSISPSDEGIPGRVPNKIIPGTIYFVATPVGNLGDITLRALDVLRGVDVIASEDTRTTGLLLKALGLTKKPQMSHHKHNVQSRVPELVRKAQVENLSIAVVSDAGTPGISDPGNELAAACWAAGVPVVPVPGACAAVAAVSVSGFASTEFVFIGFLPAKSGKSRKAKVAEVATQDRPCVLYESPNRVLRTLMEIREADETGGERMVMCARELTKLHEELFRGTLSEAVLHFGGQEGSDSPSTASPRGEFTLVLGPLPRMARGKEEMGALVREMLQVCLDEEELSASEAAKKVSKCLGKEAGLARSDVYKIALEIKGK